MRPMKPTVRIGPCAQICPTLLCNVRISDGCSICSRDSSAERHAVAQYNDHVGQETRRSAVPRRSWNEVWMRHLHVRTLSCHRDLSRCPATIRVCERRRQIRMVLSVFSLCQVNPWSPKRDLCARNWIARFIKDDSGGWLCRLKIQRMRNDRFIEFVLMPSHLHGYATVGRYPDHHLPELSRRDRNLQHAVPVC